MRESVPPTTTKYCKCIHLHMSLEKNTRTVNAYTNMTKKHKCCKCIHQHSSISHPNTYITITHRYLHTHPPQHTHTHTHTHTSIQPHHTQTQQLKRQQALRLVICLAASPCTPPSTHTQTVKTHITLTM